MKAVYETDEYKEFAKQNLADIREGFLGPDDFKKEWEEQYQIFDKIAQKTGLKK